MLSLIHVCLIFSCSGGSVLCPNSEGRATVAAARPCVAISHVGQRLGGRGGARVLDYRPPDSGFMGNRIGSVAV